MLKRVNRHSHAEDPMIQGLREQIADLERKNHTALSIICGLTALSIVLAWALVLHFAGSR